MRTSHRGQRQRAAAHLPRKINLSVFVSLYVTLYPLIFLFLLLARSLARRSLGSPLGVAPWRSSRTPLLAWGTSSSSSWLSHLHYERQDLLAAEYNADLSVSIHRDQEPSSSRVPLRRSYTYPPSAARQGTGKTEEEMEEEEEEEETVEKRVLRDRTLGVFCAWPSKSCARMLLVRRKSRNRWRLS